MFVNKPHFGPHKKLNNHAVCHHTNLSQANFSLNGRELCLICSGDAWAGCENNATDIMENINIKFLNRGRVGFDYIKMYVRKW